MKPSLQTIERSNRAADSRPTVVELFAGVGGFHEGLSRSGWRVVWANQWEPSTKTVQHAWEVYVHRYCGNGDGTVCSNDDIAEVAVADVPDHDLLVGGFPCQDYSVAKPLPKATGIRGQKGVLWWEIYRLLHGKLPRFVLLENVDRLLKSPSDQRGRDFAIMLACFDALGYSVEWRMVNAADYGFPQRRRRVFIYAERDEGIDDVGGWDRLFRSGVMARALPILDEGDDLDDEDVFDLPESPALPSVDAKQAFDSAVNEWAYDIGRWEHLGSKRSPFETAGVMRGGRVWTHKVTPDEGAFLNRQPAGGRRPYLLRQVIAKTTIVPESYLVPHARVADWRKEKGAKKLARRSNGFSYNYSEGGMHFPEDIDKPSRTILTGEGGTSPSRFKHVVPMLGGTEVRLEDGRRVPAEEMCGDGKPYAWLRRLIPEELEELNGFPRGHTRVDVGGKRITDTRRAFLMGNALVVGVVEHIGRVIKQRAEGRY